LLKELEDEIAKRKKMRINEKNKKNRKKKGMN
jgi:hypothetical protein